MAGRKLLIADLLCGAGGSTTGAIRALQSMGIAESKIEIVCLNHWQTAIDTHTVNHPTARHYVQDIATVRPHLVVPEGYLDLLMASPTCTHHSVARGGKPTSDQQRSDPWHIVTWLTELRVKRLIIENVWEFTSWGPVDHRTGRPIKSRKGEYFQAWIDTIRRLGFEPEWRKLNAADYGDATTRQRFILMARSDGRRLIWPVPTHSKATEANNDLFASVMQPWRPARDVIDWSIRGRSIFNRKRPLAPKTLARILAGAQKFGWPDPYIHMLLSEIERSLRHMIRWAFGRRHQPKKKADREKRRKLVRDTIVRLREFLAEPESFGRPSKSAKPVVVTLRRNAAGTSVDEPIATVSAQGTHIGVAEPVVVNMKGKSNVSSIDLPLPTQTSKAPHLFSAEPIVLSQNSSGGARSADEPLPTITTGGAGDEERPGCARPMLVTVAHGNSEGDATADSRRSHDLDQPLGAIHGDGSAHALVQPFVLSQASGGSPRAVSEPIPTQTTGGNGAAHALIAPYYGSGSGETCKPVHEPLDTITSKERFGMVVPVTHTQGGNSARDVDDPLPTLTTAKGGELAVVMPVTHAGGEGRVFDPNIDPLPTVTGANRGELAFIAAQYGERDGQSPRVHDIGAPVPTIAATGHVNLVEPSEGLDILFRMLEPHELAAAMGFTTEDQEYEFTGTKTDQIKQIGNAVSVRKMKACVGAIMADVAPQSTEVVSPARAVA